MPFQPPLPLHERILTYGFAGSGKTTAILDIARWYHRTNTPGTFHILDTDFAIARMLTGYPEIQSSIKLYPCYTWTDYTTAAKQIQHTVQPTDWIAVDFISTAWESVVQHYVEQVFNKDIGDYFIFARKANDKALEGWTDWNVINAMYKQWMNPLLFRTRAHIYMTAKAENLSSDKKPTESKDTRALFLPYGLKPVGQKNLPHQFHTLLLNGINPVTNDYTLTTVKDRERQKVAGMPIKSFSMSYLRDIAGWKIS